MAHKESRTRLPRHPTEPKYEIATWQVRGKKKSKGLRPGHNGYPGIGRVRAETTALSVAGRRRRRGRGLRGRRS